MEYVLTTQGLSKRYGKVLALDGLDMRVPRGAIYGLVGKNGTGKTTLMRLICGLQRPSGGRYTLYGVEGGDSRAAAGARGRMGAMVESPALYLDMSARDNLRCQYRVLGLPSFGGIPELLGLVGLAETGRKKARQFSLGMRQRLGIAMALAGTPDFLALDEPTNGLDPQGIVEIRELILKLNRERRITVLISSHILPELGKLATHFGFIDRGRMAREISAGELEAACRKSLRLEVSDPGALCRVLDRLGVEYRMCSDRGADLYGAVGITPLVLALAEEGCEVLSMAEREESLESYFINLVGGDGDA